MSINEKETVKDTVLTADSDILFALTLANKENSIPDIARACYNFGYIVGKQDERRKKRK